MTQVYVHPLYSYQMFRNNDNTKCNLDVDAPYKVAKLQNCWIAGAGFTEPQSHEARSHRATEPGNRRATEQENQAAKGKSSRATELERQRTRTQGS